MLDFSRKYFCHFCHKAITETDDYTSDDHNIFCSEDCYFHNNRCDDPVAECSQCLVPIESYQDAYLGETNIFCSTECSKTWNKS